MDGFMLEEGVQVGDCNTILGTLDGVPYNLWAMKETDYIMKMTPAGIRFMQGDHPQVEGERSRGSALIPVHLSV
jgi:hypothetical protein